MKRWICRAAIAMVVIALGPILTPAAATAAPTAQPWVVVLCKFTDRQQEPHGVAYYQDMFANPGKGGLYDYWRDVSYELNGCAQAANNDVDFSKYTA